MIILITGISGSGKTTIAKEIVDHLRAGVSIDGDSTRKFFNDYDFSRSGVRRNLVSAAHAACILEATRPEPVILAFIAPYKLDRDFIREKSKNFIEIFIDTPLGICKNRRPEIYGGEFKNVAGLDLFYERPQKPDLIIDGSMDLKDNKAKVRKFFNDNA